MMTFGFTWDMNCGLLGQSPLYSTSPDIASDGRRMTRVQNTCMKGTQNWTLAYTLHVFSHCKTHVICKPLGESGLVKKVWMNI